MLKIIGKKAQYTLLLTAMFFAGSQTFAQTHDTSLPRLIEKNGRHAFLVDGKPFLMLGGQAHNSSAWPALMPEVWKSADAMHLNTLEVPLYWEQIEPQAGKFDFSLVDMLLTQARQHNVHLVLLWFGTWKNGSNHYMPEWMKRDAEKYPNITGKTGKPIDSPSPHSKATLDADIRAFSAVMHYLKQADTQHTVIMVQVENEPGSWDTVRDYSAKAQKLFEADIPPELLKPAILKTLNVPENTKGPWAKVFGERADEYFQAWSIARFIEQVAAAGKAEYPLPLYVNVALRDPLTNPPATHYESGGATDNVIPIWKAAAPSIDLLAPDIYLSGSERVLKVIDLYTRADNTLFVPEAGLIADNAKYFYDVLAHGGIGFSPFGIDNNGDVSNDDHLAERLTPFADEYAMASPMMRELAQWAFENKIKAVVEHEDGAEQTINLGPWDAVIKFGSGRGGELKPNKDHNGKAMIVTLDENKFIMTGTNCRITFHPAGGNTGKAWQYLKAEEGQYDHGVFKSLRILNGDETDWGGPAMGDQPRVLRISLVVR
ncbi:Beta-galactosidase GanA [Mucilaginibacter gossypiicola]|uniref:Beta-galactosidase GanA n=1 Tax=Mucilaginibacter gossypiicola TaxID=551995 RepID=A0A1H8QS46_9SPHI|nr:DUF5597 domain-containing protein [Mucilaginibacter gossypiicola]SEO56798.1 Beta-galactosidase GanA [Mucilaginibacter gossypiicola]